MLEWLRVARGIVSRALWAGAGAGAVTGGYSALFGLAEAESSPQQAAAAAVAAAFAVVPYVVARAFDEITDWRTA